MKLTKTYYIVLLLISFFISCTEPYNLKSIDFEDALIIEAIITDEVKHQEIKLSRTFSLEEFKPSAESNATVLITDNSQNVYEFEEIVDGNYTSKIAFGAESNKEYTLSVTTENGKVYKSQPTVLPSIVPINNLYASREISEETGNENMTVFVDGLDPSGNSKYFRYEYEETYEIIAPAWTNKECTGDLSIPFNREACDEAHRRRQCFNTVASDSIIQLRTDNLSQSKQSPAFPVRVISRNDAIIRTRYSILVKQYIQSLEAFTFYEILSKFSSSDNLFSQNQPGFFSGNLYAVDNKNEKVVGFFDVSSFSSKRIFFNFSDFFPAESLPSFFGDCTPFEIDDDEVLQSRIDAGEIVNYSHDPNKPFLWIEIQCWDCREIGTTIKPDFWID